jgi:hypothetical protein
VSALPSDSSAATASALANASEDELPNELWDIEFDLDLSFPRAWSGANIRSRAKTDCKHVENGRWLAVIPRTYRKS